MIPCECGGGSSGDSGGGGGGGSGGGSGVANVAQKFAKKRTSLEEDGLGAHDLLKGKLGSKWKWERHRSHFFHQHFYLFLTWTCYLTIELIVHATAVSEGVRAGRVKL